jgi:hypothetical protein
MSLERVPETSAVPRAASSGEKDDVEGERDAKLFSRRASCLLLARAFHSGLQLFWGH